MCSGVEPDLPLLDPRGDDIFAYKRPRCGAYFHVPHTSENRCATELLCTGADSNEPKIAKLDTSSFTARMVQPCR